MSDTPPDEARPDIYTILHREIGRDTAARLADVIETELGWSPPSPRYPAVAAAFAAFVRAMPPHWDADNGGTYVLRDLELAIEIVRAHFP